MARTANILSRVYRNLRRHGIKTNDLIDQEIFDELVLGQDHIISEAFPDKVITIALVEGQSVYNLTTDDVEEGVERINIASVKVSKLPAGWASADAASDFSNVLQFPEGFTVIINTDFVDIINANPGIIGRPRIATIIDNKLEVYPVPSEEEDAEEIKLYTYISSSSGVIDDENEPEVTNIFDKALENYATSQFLSGEERTQYMAEFTYEVKRLKPIQNRKHHNLSRAPLTGWW